MLVISYYICYLYINCIHNVYLILLYISYNNRQYLLIFNMILILIKLYIRILEYSFVLKGFMFDLRCSLDGTPFHKVETE